MIFETLLLLCCVCSQWSVLKLVGVLGIKVGFCALGPTFFQSGAHCGKNQSLNQIQNPGR